MDKNEKLKLGYIYFAPKEFFLNNSRERNGYVCGY